MDRLVGDPAEREALVANTHAEIRKELERDRNPAPVPARARPQAAEPPRQDLPVPVPRAWGPRRVPVELADVWQYLDRNTLFRLHWGGHRAKGPAYERLVQEVFEPELQRLQEEAVAQGWLQPAIAAGAFPCNADGDRLIIFDPDQPEQGRELAQLSFPRQADGERLCLADYFKPRASGVRDVVVLQAVTVGAGAGAYIEELQREADYSRMLYVNGLASSTAEALAESANRWARQLLGLPEQQGLRFSWGYAACPDLEAQRDVLALLGAEERIGLRLSESANLDPEHSTVALVVPHPQAKYFAVRADS
jgi:5-methyltetrahydrofolate--homocysteine methyltransferase